MQQDKINRIIQEIKLRSGAPAIRGISEVCKDIGVAQSKIGGYPYWEPEREYPHDERGRAMCLLAQINFAEIKCDRQLLPNKGLLQFYISPDNDLYGANFNSLLYQEQKNYRVVFYENYDPRVTERGIKAQGIKAFHDLIDGCLVPLTVQKKLSFENFTDYPYERLEDLIKDVLSDVYGECIEGSLSGVISDEEESAIMEAFCGAWCTKIFGYPNFTQFDPREEGSDERMKYFDTLLLQIDSDKEILWGDCGVANFFINSEALKNLDFSNVLYNWDCY